MKAKKPARGLLAKKPNVRKSEGLRGEAEDELCMTHAIDLLLDSGAYSAWRLKKRGKAVKPIDLAEYIGFIKRNEQWLWRYVNLDVIPDEKEDAAEAAKQSYANLFAMRKAGLNPIPVMHEWDHPGWLRTLLDDGHDYIGLAPRKDGRPGHQDGEAWLDLMFSTLPPHIKTHGFGVTKSRWLFKYPFYTVDSTTWWNSAGKGSIYVPPIGEDGDFDYAHDPSRYCMSGRSQERAAKQFELEDRPHEVTRVRRFVEEAGFLLIEARNDEVSRRKLILHYYNELSKRLADKQPWQPAIFHATSFNPMFSEELQLYGVRTQLLSYFYLPKTQPDALRSYITAGVKVRTREPKAIEVDWERGSRYLKQRVLALARRLKAPPAE